MNETAGIHITKQSATEYHGPAPDAATVADVVQSLVYYAEHPDQIDGRLRELREEWDIERTLVVNASVLSLFGLIAGTLGKRRLLLLLPLAMSGLLLHSVFRGWSPPLDVLRRLGVRTKEEIALEYDALRALRGDYEPVRPARDLSPSERVHQIVGALQR